MCRELRLKQANCSLDYLIWKKYVFVECKTNTGFYTVKMESSQYLCRVCVCVCAGLGFKDIIKSIARVGPYPKGTLKNKQVICINIYVFIPTFSCINQQP